MFGETEQEYLHKQKKLLKEMHLVFGETEQELKQNSLQPINTHHVLLTWEQSCLSILCFWQNWEQGCVLYISQSLGWKYGLTTELFEVLRYESSTLIL